MSETETNTLDTVHFFDNEVADVLKKVDGSGPIESFSIPNEAEVQEIAIETGIIAPGSFENCGAFSDEDSSLEEKRYRYEAKRAIEIQKILDEAVESDEKSAEQKSQALYIDKVMAQAVLVEAARKYKRALDEGNLTDRDAELYDRAIDTAQEVLFPQPDSDIVDYAISRVLSKAVSVDPEQAMALRERYPFMETRESNVSTLSDERKSEWHEMLHQKFDPIFDKTRERMGDTELSNDTLADWCRTFMEEAGLPMADEEAGKDGWKVVERDDVAGFRVHPGARELVCGKRKQEITWSTFTKLMMHEVEVHVMRAQNGFEAHNSGLQTGLPGSQETEEGLGLLIEGLWSDGPLDAVGRDHFRYLAVCYADGRLDGERHTETETLSFTSALVGIQKKGRFQNPDEMKTARKLSFDHVKRAFRGMPPGKIMDSNLSYLSGKVKVIGLLAESRAKPQALFGYLQQGKFNPFDERHHELVNPLESYELQPGLE